MIDALITRGATPAKPPDIVVVKDHLYIKNGAALYIHSGAALWISESADGGQKTTLNAGSLMEIE